LPAARDPALLDYNRAAYMWLGWYLRALSFAATDSA